MQALLNYTIIDLKTTGFRPGQDEIIELAAIRIREGRVVDHFETLIQPSRPLSSLNEQLLGYSNNDLNQAPSIAESLPFFLAFLKEDMLLSYNVQSDMNFIEAMIDGRLSNEHASIQTQFQVINPKFKNLSMRKLANYFEIATNLQQGALANAYIKFYLYQQFVHNYLSKNNGNHLIKGRTFVFTGKLSQMVRTEAWYLVRELGGTTKNTVTKDIDYLVIADSRRNLNGEYSIGLTRKMRLAQALLQGGHPIQIITEEDFYRMVATN